jgi:dienelactone hydrolase
MLQRTAMFSICALLIGCGGSAASEGATSDSGSAGPNGAIPIVEDTGSNELPPEDAIADVAPEAAAEPWSADLVAPALPCADAPASIYEPADLAARELGDVIHCTTDPHFDLDTVKSRLTGKAVEALTGVKQLRISYRTTKGDGSPTFTSARVYLPDVPHTPPPGWALPVIAAGHPSEGLADSCAPSKREDTLKEAALPWAARGYAIVAPDLPDLGTDGVQAYLDNHEQGQALLDGARALRKLLKKGAFGSKVVVTGYSQGGGAALSAQALAKSYGVDGELSAVVVFAPQWPTRIESFGFLDLLKNPDDLTIVHGYSFPVVAVLRTYAWFANHGHLATGGIPEAKRSSLQGSIDSLCLIPFGGAMQAAAPKVSDFIDEDLRKGLLACIASASDPACAGTAKEYYTWLLANHLTGDASGAPVFYVQGALDTVMPAASEAACNVPKLRNDGVNVTVCNDAAATHSNIADRNVGRGIEWAESKIWGTAEPTCDDSLPACAK